MRMVFLLTIGMFTLGFDAYVVAGLLPDIGATFKTSDSQTGQAVTVFTLCFALAAPVFATLLAGKPARRILVIALVIFSLGNALSALTSNFPLLLLARAIAGIGAGLYSPLATAAAAALVPPQKRGRALGTVLGGMSLGTVIGVPLGLIMATEIGWHGTLWLITTLGIIALIGIILWFPDIPASQPASLRQRFAMMTNGRVAATVGITFVAALASLGLYTYIAPILQDLQEIHQVTPYLWAWGIGGVIGNLSIGTLIDRIGRPSWIIGGILALLTLAMFSLPLVLGIPFLAFLPFMVWGAMGWASLAPQQHVLLQLQPEHGSSVVVLNSSANYLGGSMGSALGGIVMVGGLTPSYLPIASGCIVSRRVL
ncbi:MFS transporter [Agaribacter marinus]|uniref:MFS transporter n=1 Tax=Virgibacillus salarius TaxID=447199 RepID=A0A941DY65_9BACI|nr:MFS transporter [Virgibacillus salarius]MBR7796333.1 MFS transporter [Virgibacillus salarius]NAZ09042.1 MFS transporter [Agaribacter marinus]